MSISLKEQRRNSLKSQFFPFLLRQDVLLMFTAVMPVGYERWKKNQTRPAVTVHTAERGVELEPTPAETSQEASGEGEGLSGKVDVGSNGMEPREGPKRTGRGEDRCWWGLLATHSWQWVDVHVDMYPHVQMFYPSEDFQWHNAFPGS